MSQQVGIFMKALFVSHLLPFIKNFFTSRWLKFTTAEPLILFRSFYQKCLEKIFNFPQNFLNFHNSFKVHASNKKAMLKEKANFRFRWMSFTCMMFWWLTRIKVLRPIQPLSLSGRTANNVTLNINFAHNLLSSKSFQTTKV